MYTKKLQKLPVATLRSHQTSVGIAIFYPTTGQQESEPHLNIEVFKHYVLKKDNSTNLVTDLYKTFKLHQQLVDNISMHSLGVPITRHWATYLVLEVEVLSMISTIFGLVFVVFSFGRRKSKCI
uniref:Uncharacterized protein n=1 Tax=Glossina austeni TaxID=7395 RepID=A0A1A9UMM9_GLOAU